MNVKSPRPKVMVGAILIAGLFLRSELGGESTHLFCNGFVYDFCIGLCGTDIGMAQHSGYDLERYAVGKGHARKGMAGDMHCQRFVYAAYSISFFLSIFAG